MGYDLDPVTRRLQVNELEAERVRQIFGIYSETQSLIDTVAEINGRGWQTKSWLTQKGRLREGGPFRWPVLRVLLTNVLYAGLIRPKKELIAAQQPAIVNRELFERVAALLQAQQRGPRQQPLQRQALLTGLLCCNGCGTRMFLTYTKRPYGRVRYYACGSWQRKRERLCPAGSLPADLIERLVMERVWELNDDLVRGEFTIGLSYLQSVFTQIRYDSSQGRLSVTLRQPAADQPTSDNQENRPPLPQPPCEPASPGPDTHPESLLPGRLHRVSRLLALAIKCEGLIQSRVARDYSDLAFLGGVAKARLTQIMNLLHLAPDIQECLLFLPTTTLCRDRISERQLRDITKLVDWSQQRERFADLYPAYAGVTAGDS